MPPNATSNTYGVGIFGVGPFIGPLLEATNDGADSRSIAASKGQITGVVYLLYFLTAMLAQFLFGRKLVAYSNATNLIATGCYVVLTLLLVNIFKPVNRSLSLLAASFNVVGLTFELLQFQPQGVNIGLGFHGLRDLSQRSA